MIFIFSCHECLAYLFKMEPWQSQIFSHFAVLLFFVSSQIVQKQSTILLPPLAEQQEIAAYLDEKCAAIGSIIASKEAPITKLETYKKCIIYEYVTDKRSI